MVWIREDARHKGLGKSMLETAEAEARSRSCAQIVLSTHSFQAPGFYRKLGFSEVCRVRDFPRGYDQIWLVKRLG